jgi:hypothetical protein
METLKRYISNNSPKSGFLIYTRLAHYRTDRVKLLESILKLGIKSNLTICNRVDIAKPNMLYIYLESADIFPLADHHRICKVIRDSRFSAHPYYLGKQIGKHIVSADLANIASVEEMKAFTRKTFQPNDTIAIDSSLVSDELEIVKDMLCLLVMENVPFRWMLVGQSPISLMVTHGAQFLRCLRFGNLDWNKIICSHPCSDNIQQVNLLPDEDTAMEVNCKFGNFTETRESDIVAYLPQM